MDANRSLEKFRPRWWQKAILVLCYAVAWAHILTWVRS